jgi:membrane-associated HD superfamily phosphohydrolase
MKKLADQQKLYLIIADSDYIYGTNYQFCHGYLSKDLELTQEKIIQALGRIGRNNIQQEYSARFRDDIQITTLFTKISSENKPEVINMNQLFNCKNIKWNGVEYEELPDEEVPTTFGDEEDEEEEEEEDVV